jgi:cell division protein FtsL
MYRRVLLFVLFAAACFGATVRLYLKDGTYQMAREYQVVQDRVRFYSTERSDWEEIPLELVDLDRTKKEIADHDAELKEEANRDAEEDKAVTEAAKEAKIVPAAPGAYYLHGEQLETIKAVEQKIVGNKRRSVLKALSPLPMVTGKQTVEIDGDSAALKVGEKRPEFYFRLSDEERFGIIKLRQTKKGARVVEDLDIIPVTKEVMEKHEDIPTFKKQEGDLLFKIWPENDLAPGEYALVQYTEGKVNMQVFDFSVP